MITHMTVDANTTADHESAVVTVIERNSITLSCISTGAPAPTISWEFNGQDVMITPTESSASQAQATLIRDPNDMSRFIPNIVLGTITSTIEIINARYPDDDGVYTCIGTNDNLKININEAMITLQVIGKQEIMLLFVFRC